MTAEARRWRGKLLRKAADIRAVEVRLRGVELTDAQQEEAARLWREVERSMAELEETARRIVEDSAALPVVPGHAAAVYRCRPCGVVVGVLWSDSSGGWRFVRDGFEVDVTTVSCPGCGRSYPVRVVDLDRENERSKVYGGKSRSVRL